MATFKVNVNKLNLRKSPVKDFTNKKNVVGVLAKDAVFESVGMIENELGRWQVGKDGNCVSDKWLSDDYPFWMTSLKLPMIWETYDEQGANAKVAVLDTGYNINNPEIKANVIGEHISILNSQIQVSINDENGHGSLCASLIASRNFKNYLACAPKSKLYIAKISSQQELRYQFLIDGIDWAISQNVDIISISYGARKDDGDLQKKISDATINHNIIVVAAIGNNDPERGQNGGDYPALYDECLSVGATDKYNQISLVTKRNSKTNINAPGENILGYLKSDFLESTPHGTSQATAIVAGICSLIVSRYKALNKVYTVKEIFELITTNFDSVIGSPDQKLISPGKIFSKIK